LYAASAGLLFHSSCTKEEIRYETVSKLADNRIIEYKVANLQEGHTIYSSIDNDKRTITVFLPHYYALPNLEVQATLPEGARISPKPEDEPVPVFSEAPFAYEVTGKSGEKATYRVNVIVQQPKLSIDELSPSATNPRTMPKTLFRIYGKNFIPDPNATKLSLWNEDGTLAHDDFRYIAKGNYERTAVLDWAPENIDHLQAKTKYWVEVQCYALKARTRWPIYITK